jgi:uncharacterized protein
MVLEGVVTNVAAFGAFVDVGVHQDGLVHVSAMSRSFVSDPRALVKPGDVVKVKVLGVDHPRKRISLTMRLDDDPDGSGGAVRQGPGSTRDRGQGPGSTRDRGQGPGGARDRGRGDQGRDPRGQDRQGGGRGSGAGDQADPGGTMADALRRAGLA